MWHDGDSDGFLSAGGESGGGGLRAAFSRHHRWTIAAVALGLCGAAAVAFAALTSSATARARRHSGTDRGEGKVGLIPGVHIDEVPAAAGDARDVPVAGISTTPGIGLMTAATPKEWTTAKMWQTARDGGYWNQQADVQFVPDFNFLGPVVDISRETGQTIAGFGGAFTEAAALVFSRLPPKEQNKFIAGYFGPDSLGYTLGRVHINSCDFAAKSYAFDDVADDFNLTHFDDAVSHDTKALIPLIVLAQDALKSQGKRLRLLATPWSPPAWMKSNGMMDHSVRPCWHKNMQPTWANYITRWITAYKNHDVPIWAITVQNEPENDAVWESCLLTPEEEAGFLGTYLGPALKEAHPEVLVFAYDHNKNNIYQWANVLYSNPNAARHINGIAFHWYSGDGFEALQQVHQSFPQAELLATEATYERRRWQAATTIQTGEWSFGEGYAHDIVGDLNAGSTGWIDWNLLLDQNGGPNHANNACDAAAVADIRKGELFYHPQYYFIGHFSKYIVPGSKHLRTAVRPLRSYQGIVRDYGTCTDDDGLQVASFLRPDGYIVVVALNCGDNIIGFKLRDGPRAALANIPPHAIQTYLLPSS